MDLPEEAKRAASAPVWNQSFPSPSFPSPEIVNVVFTGHYTIFLNKTLSCRRETASCTVSWEILVTQAYSRSFRITIACMVLHCKYGHILYHFWDIQHRIMTWPWIQCWMSFKVIESATSLYIQLTTCCQSVVVTIARSCTIFELFDVE